MAPPDVTSLLRAWRQGDSSARDDLVPLVYQEFHRRARAYLRRERRDHTLQPTALVYEAYQRDLRVHFGVGRIERLEIRWASAATDSVAKLDANQVITVREGGGVVERRPFATTGSMRETQASGRVPPLR